MTFKEFMRENGYEVRTTFWEDFSIADLFGLPSILDTFKRAFKEWKGNYVYLTELVWSSTTRFGSIINISRSMRPFTTLFGSRRTNMRLNI